MSNRLFVGNIAYNTTEEEFVRAFLDCGFTPRLAALVMDKETGRAKGFGFIEMDSVAKAQEAISVMDGTMLGGRPIRVSVANERERRR